MGARACMVKKSEISHTTRSRLLTANCMSIYIGRSLGRVDSNSNDCVLRAPGSAAAASQHQPAGGPCCCAHCIYTYMPICQAVDLYCPFVTAAAARLAQSHNNLAPCCLYIVYAVYRYTYTDT